MKQKRTQEIELRALLDRDEFDSIMERLARFGAEVCEDERVVDTYFCPKDVMSFDALEMNNLGSYSLRLRQSGNSVDLNTKVITRQGDHNSWEEHEVVVDSYEETKKILESIGFKSFITIAKNRHKYKLDNMGIFLEDIDDFGLAIEVEIMATEDEDDEAKRKIGGLFDRLNISSDKIVPKSITNIIMREKAEF